MGPEDTTTTISADDLSHIKAEEDGATADKGAVDKAGKGANGGEKTATKTVATGADSEEEDKTKQDAADKARKPGPFALTDEMRQQLAEYYAAGDKKTMERELKRLQRVGGDMKSIWGLYRELDNRLNGGGLVKVPGKDAKPEEVAAFHKALGVPDKPEDYFKQVKLENGAVIGEADKPLVDAFAAELHKVGAPPAAMSAALNWYYKQQEDAAAALDEADDGFRRESESTLKEEMGAAFKRKTNAIAALFAQAPGGADVSNEGSLYARLMGGRTTDGKLIGNDPDVVRFLVGLVSEVNPAATIVEDGKQSGLSLDQEIASIEKRMKEDRRGYFKDEPAQARYRELLETRSKIQARR